jgi:hypothetical protein
MKIDLESFITSNKFFKWKEALYLPSIKTYHIPSDKEVKNIVSTCEKLDVCKKTNLVYGSIQRIPKRVQRNAIDCWSVGTVCMKEDENIMFEKDR